MHCKSLWIKASAKCINVNVLRDFLHKFVLVYIDDIREYRTSPARCGGPPAHERLQPIPEGWEMLIPSVLSALGYIISEQGIQMDEGKVKAVHERPIPTFKELQWFLGFTNFYWRFIKDFSSIVHCLTSLLKGKPKSLSWTPAATQAFEKLKETFTTAPLLVHPDPSRPFWWRLMPLPVALERCCLSSMGTQPNSYHVPSFFRKFTPAGN